MSRSARELARPAGRSLASRRPAVTLARVESNEDRKRRLARLSKLRRQELGIVTEEDLARLADEGGPSVRSIRRIESAERRLSSATYNAYEDALGLPLGTMEGVLDGKVAEFPNSVDHGEQPPTGAGKTFTKADLQVLARALGPEGLYSWVMSEQ